MPREAALPSHSEIARALHGNDITGLRDRAETQIHGLQRATCHDMSSGANPHPASGDRRAICRRRGSMPGGNSYRALCNGCVDDSPQNQIHRAVGETVRVLRIGRERNTFGIAR